MQNALGQSNLIESKRLEMREAQEEYTQARAASLPQFSFSGSFGYANRQSNSSVASINDVSTSQETGGLRAGVSQPIYTGGQIKSQKRRAKAGITAAEQDLRATTSDVALSTIQAHLDVIRANNVLAIFTRSVANLEAQKTTTSLLFDYGEATIADASLVEARLQSTKVEAGQARLRLTESLTNYQFLTGQRANNLTPPPFVNLPPTLDQAVNIALVKNPDVLKARAEWDVAQNSLKIAKAQRLPSLSLDGAVSESLGQSDFVASSSAATLSMNLRVPFSLGGQYKSQIKQATHALSRRKFDERQTMVELRREITLKWNGLQTASDSINLRHQEIAANDAAYRSLQEQFQSGVTTQSELLSAESDLLSANIKLEDAKYQEQFLRAELLALLGNLDMAGHNISTSNSYVEAPLTNHIPRSRY
ncbi:membrane protein [Algimonas arctica]|uniref:Membrane protein n=1 Tax=Algimonas arctica TaxID=1479486 RepID=A0A8J3CV20_9PROT|nr:TolC family protein [Algimonas arctica]GHB05599.1 membrane protein [Algimonas arctica]